jgi:hypothetical protein
MLTTPTHALTDGHQYVVKSGDSAPRLALRARGLAQNLPTLYLYPSLINNWHTHSVQGPACRVPQGAACMLSLRRIHHAGRFVPLTPVHIHVRQLKQGAYVRSS